MGPVAAQHDAAAFHKGKCIFWDKNRGFGKMEWYKEGVRQEDIFAHHTNLEGGLTELEPETFYLFTPAVGRWSENNPYQKEQAKPVWPLELGTMLDIGASAAAAPSPADTLPPPNSPQNFPALPETNPSPPVKKGKGKKTSNPPAGCLVDDKQSWADSMDPSKLSEKASETDSLMSEPCNMGLAAAMMGSTKMMINALEKLNADMEKVKTENASMRRYIRLLEEKIDAAGHNVPMVAEWPTIMETRVGKLEGAVKTLRENMLTEARNDVMESSYASAASSSK